MHDFKLTYFSPTLQHCHRTCRRNPADDYHMPQKKRQATLVGSLGHADTSRLGNGTAAIFLWEASTIHIGDPYIIIFYRNY